MCSSTIRLLLAGWRLIVLVPKPGEDSTPLVTYTSFIDELPLQVHVMNRHVTSCLVPNFLGRHNVLSDI